MKNKAKKTIVDYLKRNRIENRLMAYRLLEKEYNDIAKQKDNKKPVHFCLHLRKYLFGASPSSVRLVLLSGATTMDLIEKKMPELFSLRPSRGFFIEQTETAYWFAPDDAKSRAELLKKAQVICSGKINEFRKNQLLNKKKI